MSDLHVIFDHGDEQRWADRLAACRTAALGPPGTPFYEEWLAATVTDPNSVARCVEAALAESRGRLAKIREWAMANEIAEPPLDWAGLGEILNG